VVGSGRRHSSMVIPPRRWTVGVRRPAGPGSDISRRLFLGGRPGRRTKRQEGRYLVDDLEQQTSSGGPHGRGLPRQGVIAAQQDDGGSLAEYPGRWTGRRAGGAPPPRGPGALEACPRARPGSGVLSAPGPPASRQAGVKFPSGVVGARGPAGQPGRRIRGPWCGGGPGLVWTGRP